MTRNQQLFQYVWQGALLACLLTIALTVHRRNGKLVIESKVGKLAVMLLVAGFCAYIIVTFVALLFWVVGGGFTF